MTTVYSGLALKSHYSELNALASHIHTRVRQILIAKSVIGDESGTKDTAGYFRSAAELAAVVVQVIFIFSL